MLFYTMEFIVGRIKDCISNNFEAIVLRKRTLYFMYPYITDVFRIYAYVTI